jgi:hypothetical protein
MTKIQADWDENNFHQKTLMDRIKAFDHEYSNVRNRPRLYAVGGFTTLVTGIAIRGVDAIADISNGHIDTVADIIGAIGVGVIAIAGAVKLDLFIGDSIPKIKSLFVRPTQSEELQSDQV